MNQSNSHGPDDGSHESSQSDPPRQESPETTSDERVDSRAVRHPPVDSAEATVFGRPNGVTGGFDTLHAPDSRAEQAAGSRSVPAQPPASLTEAFGRPVDSGDGGLQRPLEDTGADPAHTAQQSQPSLWGSEDEPWRDPAAGATLDGPALAADEQRDSGAQPARDRMLSLPEVLLGRRVKPTALGLLGVLVLLIGACGGLVGWGLASMGDSLTGELHVAESQASKERAPGSVAAVAQRVAPAVVSVEVNAGNSGGLGSGVVIDPQGYILTNHHVVALAERNDKAKITTVFTDGTRVRAKVVGTDPKTDLAVLKVDVDDPVVVQIGSSDELVAGDSVIAIGSPFGLSNTVTSGIVSAVHRPITAPGEQGSPPVTFDAIQTDAPINPGNSGGALVDSTGALVGINSLIRTVGDDKGQGGSIGLGFAIPVEHAMEIAGQLIEHGKVTHPQIGVNPASVASYSSAGARIKNVVADGPADEAGIKEGDVVVRVGGRQVRDAAELVVAVRAHDVGDVVPVKLVRADRKFTVDVKLVGD